MLHRQRRLAVIIAVMALTPLVGRAEPPLRTHDITVEDYFTINLIADCAASPYGKYVAYTELHWGNPDESRSTDLWVVETATQRRTRLTFEPGNDDSPEWAPDGQHLYFVAKRNRGEKRPPYDGSQQVWVTGTHPGEPFPIRPDTVARSFGK